MVYTWGFQSKIIKGMKYKYQKYAKSRKIKMKKTSVVGYVNYIRVCKCSFQLQMVEITKDQKEGFLS